MFSKDFLRSGLFSSLGSEKIGKGIKEEEGGGVRTKACFISAISWSFFKDAKDPLYKR